MTHKTLGALIAVSMIGAAPLVSAANITGNITLKGTPPQDRVIPMTDPSCGKLHEGKEPPRTQFYIVGPNNELADVFVYLKGETLEGKEFPTPEEDVVLDQIDCFYVPYVLGAQTGQTIRVKNSDPLFHNVHPTPRVSGNREYNRAHLPGAADLLFSWDNPEIFITFRCDVHPWMFAYLGLLDHPFFAVTDKDGKFEIKDVPPGKYTIEAIHRRTHPRFQGVTQEIEVTEADQTVDFVIELP